MEIIDHKTGVPIEYYLQVFSASKPEEMSLRSGVPYSDGSFSMTLMGRGISLSWPEMIVTYINNGAEAKANIRILAVRRVLEGKRVPFFGKMLAYTEMPWGNVYENQFKGRCISRLAYGYGNDLSKFENACLAIAGTSAKGGDMAFDIPFLDGLIVRLIVWEGDEEFPPSAQFLFSDNFPSAFKAEDIAVTGDIILDAMKGRW